MKIQGIDGKTYVWSLIGYLPSANDDRPRSDLHLRARALLKKLFSFEPILEEVFLPGSGGLYLDFYLPGRKLAVEVQGEQHFAFNKFYHKTYEAFLAGKKRDRDKRSWIDKNGLNLVELPYGEGDELWQRRILES